MFLFQGQEAPYHGVLVDQSTYQECEISRRKNEVCLSAVKEITPVAEPEFLLSSFVIGVSVGIPIGYVLHTVIRSLAAK